MAKPTPPELLKRNIIITIIDSRSTEPTRRPKQALLLAVACLVTFVGLACPRTSVAKPALAEAMSAVFRITDGATSGTAYVVEVAENKLVVVTCAHAMNGFRGDKCTLVLRTADGEGGFRRRETTAPIRDGKRPLWKQHAKLDIAVFSFEPPKDIEFRAIKLAQLADAKYFDERDITVGDDVYIPGFPVQLEGNAAGWPIARKGFIATHPIAPSETTPNIFIDAKTYGGDSGAPIVQLLPADDESSFTVVGMIWGMRRQTDRSKTPYEERVTHTPLGIAEAVTAPHIRATIELLE